MIAMRSGCDADRRCENRTMRCPHRGYRSAVAATGVEAERRMLLVHRTGRLAFATGGTGRRDASSAGWHRAENRAAGEEQAQNSGMEAMGQQAPAFYVDGSVATWNSE